MDSLLLGSRRPVRDPENERARLLRQLRGAALLGRHDDRPNTSISILAIDVVDRAYAEIILPAWTRLSMSSEVDAASSTVTRSFLKSAPW
jgi:hypothetical protein